MRDLILPRSVVLPRLHPRSRPAPMARTKTRRRSRLQRLTGWAAAVASRRLLTLTLSWARRGDISPAEARALLYVASALQRRALHSLPLRGPAKPRPAEYGARPDGRPVQ